jgi:beta-lactamase class A
VVEELRRLPGQAGFAVARLGGTQPVLLASHQPDRALAIGSAFKLVVLGELSRQVREGRRRWTDVVTIDRHSLPSGLLQEWPLGAPLTVHSLAALMISRSDNTATDVLLRLVGRENVERMMTRMGVARDARNAPFLSTQEAFAIKRDPQLFARWRSADERRRRALLEEIAGRPLRDREGRGPIAIEEVEWFASANDLVRVMDWLRREGGETAHAILAINPGVGRAAAGEFGYVGFKGGSEPGVINLTFLVRNNQGVWHVVTGSWNNPAAAVDDSSFVGLMTRALQLVR